MIKGLDDDEIEFLDLVDRTKIAADKLKNLEEEKELNDYRNRVATLQEKALNDKIHSEVNVVNKQKGSATNKSSQTNLLKGVVVKPQSAKKRKVDSEENDDAKHAKLEDTDNDKNTLTCIGILPGLGCYNDSSSDEDSSDSEAETQVSAVMDILGRKIQKKDKES